MVNSMASSPIELELFFVSCIFVTAERPPQCYVSDVSESGIGGLFHAAAGGKKDRFG
jgi:hypothetical protein